MSRVGSISVFGSARRACPVTNIIAERDFMAAICREHGLQAFYYEAGLVLWTRLKYAFDCELHVHGPERYLAICLGLAIKWSGPAEMTHDPHRCILLQRRASPGTEIEIPPRCGGRVRHGGEQIHILWHSQGCLLSEALPVHPKLTVLKLEDAPAVADHKWTLQRRASASSSYMEGSMDHWYREKHQRDHPHSYIKNKYASREYIVVCSDVDEIPRKEFLISLKQHCYGQLRDPIHLHMKMLMYNMKWQTDEQWMRAFVINKVSFCAATSIDELRRADPGRVAPNGGWHCSSFLSTAQLTRKLQSFSHQEFNKPEYTDAAHVRKCLSEGKDVLKRGGDLRKYAGEVPEVFRSFHKKMLFLQRYT
ncbi:glycosyltransferase family 17-domain-containing protein [Tribonema minus]|uniref:Glycosyltransferase family 17-domain-containing protein n=1 Tax=Tribonema minus TaxID=303371 RepID=A0A835ZIL3_9STRA|nr:glycosyltransferase family 17-domain-containing protein [Tribonema minus]